MVFLRILLRDFLIFVTKYSRDVFIKTSKSKKGYYFFNPNGLIDRCIDIQIEKEFDAVFVGTHDERKGISYLLDIWKHVVSRKPDAKLVTCGEIPNHMKHEIKLKIERET
ncbi:MAG: hypothetical protein QXU47_06910 [Candidatus Bathyarchaeia archaeon]